MKNRNLYYGLISGLIVSTGMIIWWIMPQRERIYELGTSMMFILGMMTMILGYMTIVVSHKRLRNATTGPLPFSRLFRSGLIITCISSVIYISVWMVVYENGGAELMDVIQEAEMQDIMSSDNSQEQKEILLEDLRNFRQRYDQNALFRIGMTALEVVPIGLLFSVVSSLIFRRKQQMFFS